MVRIIGSVAALHQDIIATLQVRRSTDRRLARLLARMDRQRGWAQLGHASLGEYARVRLGMDERKARDLARLGRVLPTLPSLDAAMEEGRLAWTKARELLRVVTPENVDEWISAAVECSSRELERRVSRARAGDPVPVDEDLEPERRRVSFLLESAEEELLRDVLKWLRGQSDADVEDGALLAEMARRVLVDVQGQESAPSCERYRVVLERCPDCSRHRTERGAEVSETVASEACCDAEIVDLEGESAPAGHVRRTVPPSVRAQVEHRDRRMCRVPKCRHSLHLDLHHIVPSSQGGAHAKSNLVLLCSRHHRQVHEGRLAVTGDGDRVVRVERPDGVVTHVGRDGASSDSLASWRKRWRPPG